MIATVIFTYKFPPFPPFLIKKGILIQCEWYSEFVSVVHIAKIKTKVLNCIYILVINYVLNLFSFMQWFLKIKKWLIHWRCAESVKSHSCTLYFYNSDCRLLFFPFQHFHLFPENGFLSRRRKNRTFTWTRKYPPAWKQQSLSLKPWVYDVYFF